MNRRRRSDHDGTDRAALLTQRQAQVVSLLAAGKSTREVARALGVTPHTVQAHIGMKKLGVANRLQVIAVALRDTRGSSGGKSKPRRRN